MENITKDITFVERDIKDESLVDLLDVLASDGKLTQYDCDRCKELLILENVVAIGQLANYFDSDKTNLEPIEDDVLKILKQELSEEDYKALFERHSTNDTLELSD